MKEPKTPSQMLRMAIKVYHLSDDPGSCGSWERIGKRLARALYKHSKDDYLMGWDFEERAVYMQSILQENIRWRKWSNQEQRKKGIF